MEPGFVVCCAQEFETIPSGGSRGRCESSQRDMLGQETRPSFKQSQPPARVRGRGRCQGSGEPVQFILLVKFCGLILPGVITAHCVLGSAPCFPVLYLFFKQQSSAAKEGCCYPFCTQRDPGDLERRGFQPRTTQLSWKWSVLGLTQSPGLELHLSGPGLLMLLLGLKEVTNPRLF